MNQPDSKSKSTYKKVARIGAIALAVCLLLGAFAYWLVVPGVADKVVRDKLAAAEAKFELDIEMQEVSTTGLSGVRLTGFKVTDPATDKLVAEVGNVSAAVDGFEILMGNRELSALSVRNATLYVHRYSDGSTNLERLLARRGGGEDSDDESDDASDDASAADKPGSAKTGASFLRLFGGQWPDLGVTNARVVLSADDDVEPWPVSELATETLVLDSHGDWAALDAEFTVTDSGTRPRWALPERIDMSAELRLPLWESSGQVDFSSPLELVDLGPYPFLRVGIGGFGVDSERTVSARGLSLGVQGESEPSRLVNIERVAASFRSLDPSSSLEELRPLDVHVENPKLSVRHDAQFGSAVNDLNHLMRAPFAANIHGRAKNIATEIATKKGLDIEEEEDTGGGLMAMLGEVDWTDFLSNKAPQSVSVTGARVEVEDARPLALVGSDPEVSLRDGSFEFTHRAIHGELVFRGGFGAFANGDQSRGSAQGELRWSYRDNGLDMSANIDALSLPWLVQVFDARLAERVRAGTLRVNLEANRAAKKERTDLSGLVSVEDANFFLPAITEDAVENLTTSYSFSGHYDPSQAVPEPTMLARRAIEADEPDGSPADKAKQAAAKTGDKQDADDRPPTRGGLVIESGTAKLNGIEAEFRPALYGLDGFSRRPARFDMAVKMDKVGVPELFAAVPDAIKGPVAGTEMTGTFGWELAVEVPLYRAGKMQWKSKPVLEGFELVSMPEQVDVRKMRDAFDATLYDPAIEWKREVHIPEMRPVPIDLLVDHSGLEEEVFIERRRKREWPPRYAEEVRANRHEEDDFEPLAPHPAPWEEPEQTLTTRGSVFGIGQDTSDSSADSNGNATETAGDLDDAAPPPRQRAREAEKTEKDEKFMVMWEDEEKEHPYGEYTYVPLQYVSPWMIRAAMTTEDNSFFKHGGFNWYALKDSVQDNLEAGAYVRGASTISMQLVKNVFLNRKKVMARKFQEAFLVWLMEDVVDIPKARILELYFNVIEYGPGIYGIHDAAVHYFGKRPDKLSLTEVAWLVSIVPNPKKYHLYYERGQITDGWFRRMLRYVKIMQNRERVTELEYEAAKDDKPSFYKPADGEPLMRIEREPDDLEELQEDETQFEIPGLNDFFGP